MIANLTFVRNYMNIFQSIVTVIIAALAGGVVAHIFAGRRSHNELLLRKLEEILMALQEMRLVSIELYEIYLACAQGRSEIENPMILRTKVIEVGLRYKMPNYTMLSIADVYFPDIQPAVTGLVNCVGDLTKLDGRIFAGAKSPGIDCNLQDEVNRGSVRFYESDKLVRDEVRRIAVILRNKPTLLFFAKE